MEKVISRRVSVNRQAIFVSTDSKLLSMQSTIVQDNVLFNHDGWMELADGEVEKAARLADSNTWFTCLPFTGRPDLFKSSSYYHAHHQLGQGELVKLKQKCQDHEEFKIVNTFLNNHY